jgi:hypothetical protein
LGTAAEKTAGGWFREQDHCLMGGNAKEGFFVSFLGLFA